MDAEEAVKTGLALAFLLFSVLWISTLDYSVSADPNTSENTKQSVRYLYAAVMTIFPTSELAIAIDLGAGVIASIGLVKGAKQSLQTGIVAGAFLYFFTSFIANYLTAPV